MPTADPVRSPSHGGGDDPGEAQSPRGSRGRSAAPVGQPVRRGVLDGFGDDASDRIGVAKSG